LCILSTRNVWFAAIAGAPKNQEIAMHFAHSKHPSGSQFTKMALVTLFHVVLALALIKSMNARMLTLPKLPDAVQLLLTPEPPEPPPPPLEPPRPMPNLAPPQIVVPPVEIDIPRPVTPPTPLQTTTTKSDPTPTPTPPGPVRTEPAQANPGNGALRTAVLAETCATPEYPARAARNGESGTVILALLVAADGRVISSKVQQTSGSRDLDKAAVAALSLCRFKPATNAGAAEQGWAQMAYLWKLE
jgi:protein TonB